MPRVTGIDSFREAMAGHEGEYVLIGGGACSMLFDEVGADYLAHIRSVDQLMKTA